MNEEILVGPIHDRISLKNHYKRNLEIYGKLDIISLSRNKDIKYLSEEEI